MEQIIYYIGFVLCFFAGYKIGKTKGKQEIVKKFYDAFPPKSEKIK